MRYFAVLILAVFLGGPVWLSFAGEGHEYGNNGQQQHSPGGANHSDRGHSAEATHHQHGEWLDPPEAYAGKVSDKWTDADAIARGEEIYEQNCSSCHGVDGRGTGPIAQALTHPPADLTNNFHTAPGNGDAYLFWRVSEGGTVEPFKSQGSKMPAFKSVLSAAEHWDVLAYVHTFFHQGLMEWKQSGVADDNRRASGNDS